jgi:hypothetical protein
MNTVTVSLEALVDKALYELQGPAEQGLLVSLTSEALADAADTEFTLTGDIGANVSDLIEFGSELVLVTDKSEDATPVYTVSRGYYGTTAVAHSQGTVGVVNPQYPRIRVAEGVRRSLARLEALGLPLLMSGTFTRTTNLQYVEMPAETRDVLHVGYFEPTTGRFWDIPGWRFYDNVPTGKVSTGKIVRLPRFVYNADQLEVTYKVPYRWSNHPSAPTESATVDLPEGAEDLPAIYAAAWLVTAREVSRADLAKAEEWNHAEPMRGGVSTGLIRLKWQDFYRTLDEAKRLQPAPVHRPYVKMERFY